MNAFPHITVIILNWNGLEDSKECLKSVLKNSYENYSITLIDNASKEDELSELKRFAESIHHGNKPQISFLQNDANLGFAGGNNVGIKKALDEGTDSIFLLNNDTEVDPHFLTEALRSFRTPDSSLPTPNSVGIVSPLMLNYHQRTKIDNTGHELLSNGDSIPRDRGRTISSTHELKPSSTFGACAGAALYSAPMLREIGLLDEDFFLNYEDSDLSLRAITRGWSCAFIPSSIVYHKLNASIGKIKNDSYRIRSQRNQLWAYLHNTPWPVILLNLPWILLRDLAVILISFVCLRWTITKIFLLSRWQVLLSLPKLLKKRKQVIQYQKISWYTYWKHQRSWFSTYLAYFNTILLKGKNSVME